MFSTQFSNSAWPSLPDCLYFFLILLNSFFLSHCPSLVLTIFALINFSLSIILVFSALCITIPFFITLLIFSPACSLLFILLFFFVPLFFFKFFSISFLLSPLSYTVSFFLPILVSISFFYSYLPFISSPSLFLYLHISLSFFPLLLVFLLLLSFSIFTSFFLFYLCS